MRAQDALYVHLCVRAERCVVPLDDHEVGSWLWRRLRGAFPETVSCVLMPDHLHLLTPAQLVAAARVRLGAIVSALRRSRLRAAQNRWGKIYAEVVSGGAVKVARTSRYLVLNPSRASLVSDPLEWLWSTHRDVMGATTDPWVTADRIASATGRGRQSYHLYVSSDPSTRVHGTPMPLDPRDVRVCSLRDAWEAAVSATREPVNAVRRRGVARRAFISLAVQSGLGATSLLAEVCGVSRRMIQIYKRRRELVPPEVLQCAADPRFRAHLRDAVGRELDNLPSLQALRPVRAREHGDVWVRTS